jgi:PAS domain-containing protein
VVVLDHDLRVLVWNHGSEDLWGVRQEEVQGQHFLTLDIGLPVDQVRPALRQAMAAEDGSRSTMVDATNRRGRPGALPGHLQPAGRQRQGRARGDRGGGAAARGAGGGGVTRARRPGSVRVRGLEPLTRRLAADVADLGAP